MAHSVIGTGTNHWLRRHDRLLHEKLHIWCIVISCIFVWNGQVGAFSSPSAVKKCCYQNVAIGKWKPRRRMEDLKIGDELDDCYMIQSLFDGKTGPKVFFECGVGRIDKSGDWQMVHGMMRLKDIYPTYQKKSVIRKKANKAFEKKKPVTLYVSKLWDDHGRMEVCLDPKHAKQKNNKKYVYSASSLKEGQELEGTVVRLEPYGAFVNVGANRLGLLHISTVADLYGKYINKETGLAKAGLELNARIRVAVASNQNKRLALRFTNDVMDQSSKEVEKEEEETKINSDDFTLETQSSQEDDNEEEEEEEDPYAWAAAAYAEDYSEDDFYYEEEDDDEDRDIEDAMGLGTY